MVLTPIMSIFGTDTIWTIYMTTFVQSIFVFIVPAVLVVGWSSFSPTRYLRLQHSAYLGRDVLFGVAVFVASYVLIAFLTQWNKGVQLPEFMRSVEEWMRSMEDSALKTTERLLSGKKPIDLATNLFFVAVMAALSEELFFRGALQQFLREMTKSGHASVWISAVIFSAIHLQFYGFFPRLILGALLGYLFIYSRNLWVPVFVHFMNNALVVVAAFFWSDAEWFQNLDSSSVNWVFLLAAITSAVVTIVLFSVYKKPHPQKT